MIQEMSATSILSLLETNKEQRETFARQVVNAIRDGHADALKIHLQVKNTEALIKCIEDDPEYKALILEEAQKYGKSFERDNAKFETKEVGTKYDYSKCGDAELVELTAAFNNAKVAKEAREKFLKNAPPTGFEVVDTTSGELTTIYPPSKTSTTSVAVTLK